MGGKALVDEVALSYSKNTTIRTLMQLVPLGVGGAVDVWLESYVEKIRRNRMREFFVQLEKGEFNIDEETLKSEDYLHCFFATTKAVLNTRRREKIHLFANLLAAAVVSPGGIDVDEYEEVISILDEITFREWKALLILDEYGVDCQAEKGVVLQQSKKFWGTYCSDLEDKVGINSDEVESFLNRIARTGLYEQIVGSFFDYSGGIGYLTPRFYRFKKFLLCCDPNTGRYSSSVV